MVTYHSTREDFRFLPEDRLKSGVRTFLPSFLTRLVLPRLFLIVLLVLVLLVLTHTPNTQNKTWIKSFAPVASRGLSFDLQIYSTQAQDALHLIRTYPTVSFIINHTLMPVDHFSLSSSSSPTKDSNNFQDWKKGVELLSCEKNVAIKISGLGMCFSNVIRPRFAQLAKETTDEQENKRV
jgi:predicted TIM-barrel fold metal-dependent hydrolase